MVSTSCFRSIGMFGGFYAQLDWSEVSNNLDLSPLREVDLYPRRSSTLAWSIRVWLRFLTEDLIQRLPNVAKIAARVLSKRACTPARLPKCNCLLRN